MISFGIEEVLKVQFRALVASYRQTSDEDALAFGFASSLKLDSALVKYVFERDGEARVFRLFAESCEDMDVVEERPLAIFKECFEVFCVPKQRLVLTT